VRNSVVKELPVISPRPPGVNPISVVEADPIRRIGNDVNGKPHVHKLQTMKDVLTVRVVDRDGIIVIERGQGEVGDRSIHRSERDV